MAVAAVATGVVGGIVVVVLTAVGVRFVTQLYFLKEIRRGRHHDLGRIFPRKTSFEKATAVVDDDGFAVVERGHGTEQLEFVTKITSKRGQVSLQAEYL